MKILRLMGKTVVVYPGVYEPSDDSYILIDAATPRASGDVLDLCCGTGVVGLSLAERVDSVTAVDVNPIAVKNTFENFNINGVNEKLHAIVGDLFTPLKREGYDLVVMNPPYLWDGMGEPKDLSWNGGRRGREFINRFIEEVGDYLKEGGRALFVQSTLNDIDESLDLIEEKGMVGKVIMKKDFMFEGIVVIEVIPNS